ncbi:hypothetical protein ILYODFUR_036942 [Ilyodon furcidens]|uniref:Uncharacterized protein n=1 Tax=Ilyodon furcidens TaxID=33524 RepID=A0ABV0T705_9TELE
MRCRHTAKNLNRANSDERFMEKEMSCNHRQSEFCNTSDLETKARDVAHIMSRNCTCPSGDLLQTDDMLEVDLGNIAE